MFYIYAHIVGASTLGAAITGWCWVIFSAYWIITLIWQKRTAYHASIPSRLAYSLPLAVGLFLLFNIAGFSSFYPLNVLLFLSPLWVVVLADIFSIIGVFTAIWARTTLGSNWSGSVQLKQDHKLITSGPYAYVRHPIYTAITLLFLGTLLIFPTLGGFIGLVLVIVSCWIKLKQEEAVMLANFPNEYPSYMQRVKRLIPFVV